MKNHNFYVEENHLFMQKTPKDISPKKSTGGQQAHEKMLNIANYSVQFRSDQLLSHVRLFAAP